MEQLLLYVDKFYVATQKAKTVAKMEGAIRAYFGLLYTTHCHPFKLRWKSDLEYTFLAEKSWKFVLWRAHYLFAFFYWIYIIFLFFSNLESLTCGHRIIHLAMHSFFMLAHLAGLISQGTYFFRGDEVIQFINTVSVMIENLEWRHFGKGAFTRSRRVQGNILTFFGFYFFSKIAFTSVPISILFRDGAWMLGTHVYNLLLNVYPEAPCILVMVISVVVDCWHLHGLTGSLSLGLHINLGFMHTFKASVDNILR